MNKRLMLLAAAIVAILSLALAWVALPGRRKGPREIRVLTDRTESHLAPILEVYERAAHVSIKVVYLDKGLISRLESRPNEADVVITKDADLLEIARHKGLLQPLPSSRVLSDVPQEFRDPSGFYFSDSYRARAIFYSRARVKPEELSTYEALADPKWKGRVCIRSGYHDYNLSLFSQLSVVIGPDRLRKFLEGLSRNLARTPSGDDRGQARAIYDNKCDVAIANSYYMGIMLSSSEQRPWGLATQVFFPDQAQGGSLILRSGLALTRSTSNVQAAGDLLQYMVGAPTQDQIANLTFAYPVHGTSPLSEINQALGQGQPEVRRGLFKIRSIPLADIASQREPVLRMLDEIQFDRPR